MADRDLSVPRGGRSARRSRGSSRVSSARSSAIFDDHFHPATSSQIPGAAAAAAGQPQLREPPLHHALRPAESRFSLHEQFATTRREIEFGYDDASSVLERATLASDVGDDADLTITLENFAGVPVGGGGVAALPDGESDTFYEVDDEVDDAADETFYETLCVPRDGLLNIDEVRRAYWRAFLLLFPDGHPEASRRPAEKYFMRAQVAFEGLADPDRRAEYDMALDTGESPRPEYVAAYEERLAYGMQRKMRQGLHTSSDIGLRLDAWQLIQRARGRGQRRRAGLRPLDYTLSHSVTVPVPILGIATEEGVRQLQQLTHGGSLDICVEPPTLTVSGSVYGLAEEIFLLPASLLSDRYQPLLPLTIPRHRVIQLAENRLSPLVTVNYRQELLRKGVVSELASVTWTHSAVELETDVLPFPSLTARASGTFLVPDAEPLRVEASYTTSRHVHGSSTRPRVGLGVHTKVGQGTAFARLDSGDWTLLASSHQNTCRFFEQFSKVSRRFFYAEFPMKTAPTLELGYKTTPCERGTAAAFADAPRGESGMRGLDHELDVVGGGGGGGGGSWSVAAALTADSATGFLRYGRDVVFPSSTTTTTTTAPSPVRIEVELCSSTLLDRYLAFRSLFPVGNTTRAGLELGVSEYNLHLSVYWSRLGQRIAVPFLVSSRQDYSPGLFFWAGVAPFLAAAGAHLLASSSSSSSLSRCRRWWQRRRRRARDSKAVPPPSLLPPEVLARLVARRRAEADELTVLMHPPVEARQKHEAATGGLVIQSAKFGLAAEKGDGAGGGEDVADVTIALAALVDSGKLRIPAKLRKGCIPGFWDPVPGRKKVLTVRYVWRGKEGTVEVGSREELVLPPPV